MMKSLVCERPGSLKYKDVSEPPIIAGETLLKIERIGVCGTDLHAYEGTQPFFTYPRILGHEVAATIVHTDANDFVNGEAVTFIPYFSCGNCIACKNAKPNCCTNIKVCGVHVDGGMRTYLSVPSNSLVHGEGLHVDELALVEPLSIGAHGVRRANIAGGEFVLVVGAGPIGLGTMEFAKIAGAKVIAMDLNNERLKFCKQKLKIDFVINPGTDDALKLLKEITGCDMPTVVIDATGSLKAINNSFQYLAHGGRYVLIGLQKGDISFSHPEFHKRESTLMSSRNATRADFEYVIDCLKKGQIRTGNYITHRVKFNDLDENI
jgi:2-desacetyl-2-hydroxyethyl bacteriochlorophyllide A dehydrogenase